MLNHRLSSALDALPFLQFIERALQRGGHIRKTALFGPTQNHPELIFNGEIVVDVVEVYWRLRHGLILRLSFGTRKPLFLLGLRFVRKLDIIQTSGPHDLFVQLR